MIKLETVEDLILPNRISNILNTINVDNAKNYLFSGTQGLGKTSACNLLIKKLGLPCHEVNLNSKENRGVESISELETFISKKSSSKKIILINEVDNTSSKFLEVLKNLMDDYSEKVIFLLTTNYPQSIPTPIAESRCLHINFNPLESEKKEVRIKVGKKIESILKDNEIEVTDEVRLSIKRLLDVFLPDFRNIWNILDTALSIYKENGIFNLDFTGLSSPAIVAEKMMECFNTTSLNNELQYKMFLLWYIDNQSMKPTQAIEQFFELLIKRNDLNENILPICAITASEHIARMNGINDNPHLLSFLAKFLLLTREYI